MEPKHKHLLCLCAYLTHNAAKVIKQSEDNTHRLDKSLYAVELNSSRSLVIRVLELDIPL
jgi:hypothetical protein